MVGDGEGEGDGPQDGGDSNGHGDHGDHSGQDGHGDHDDHSDRDDRDNPHNKTTTTDVRHKAGEAAATLRERYDEREARRAQVETVGRDRLETAADTYRLAHRVLDQYESDAVGTGDFGSYLEFEGRFAEVVDVDDDAFAADAFAAADEAVDKRRLTERDFEAAREALEPAAEAVALLEDREDAATAYRLARNDAEDAQAALTDRIDELQSAAEMADADLSVDVDRIREPIRSYNDSIREAFASYYRSASARDVFDLLKRADATPFVDVDLPPADLKAYVDEHEAGTEPLPTLRSYAEYSNSKLEHYVEDVGALRTAVAVHQTYLDRIDAEPFTLAWPPAPGDELAYEIDELIPLVSRVADDETVAALRSIRDYTRNAEYDTLQRAATVRDALDPQTRELVATGVIDERLNAARETQSILEAVLEETAE